MMIAPTIEVASLGFENSLILMVLALVVFGPRRLPEIGRKIGRIMYEVRKASNDFKFQMEEELRKAEESDRRAKNEGPRNAELGAGIGVQTPALASPYPGEGVYPGIAPEAYREPAASALIQPPSTGEPVAASRPGAGSTPEPGSAVVNPEAAEPETEQAHG